MLSSFPKSVHCHRFDPPYTSTAPNITCTGCCEPSIRVVHGLRACSPHPRRATSGNVDTNHVLVHLDEVYKRCVHLLFLSRTCADSTSTVTTTCTTTTTLTTYCHSLTPYLDLPICPSFPARHCFSPHTHTLPLLNTAPTPLSHCAMSSSCSSSDSCGSPRPLLSVRTTLRSEDRKAELSPRSPHHWAAHQERHRRYRERRQRSLDL